MFQVKICGITNRDDALATVRAGADAIGLNFYPRSPRHVSLDAAREIVAALGTVPVFVSAKTGLSPLTPKEIVKVGLFVNAPPSDVCQTYDDLRLDLIQLHGDEPPEYIAQLGGRPVMRAFRVGGTPRKGTEEVVGEKFRKMDNIAPTTSSVPLAPVIEYLGHCRQLQAMPKLVMLDSLVPGEYGGTGKAADWSAAREYVAQSGLPPLVLAGGLTPDNVAEAIAAVRPAAVDVASGVESSPGRKDPAAVEAFVRAAQAAFGQ